MTTPSVVGPAEDPAAGAGVIVGVVAAVLGRSARLAEEREAEQHGEDDEDRRPEAEHQPPEVGHPLGDRALRVQAPHRSAPR
jgi:hypothetical protein